MATACTIGTHQKMHPLKQPRRHHWLTDLLRPFFPLLQLPGKRVMQLSFSRIAGHIYTVGIHHQRIHTMIDDLRSEEHTSELQSHLNLVCRLLLEKKKKKLKLKKCLIQSNSEHVDDRC